MSRPGRRPAGALTPLRQRVLDLLQQADAPLKAYDLLETLRRERGRAAPTLVYRTLAHLCERGLVQRLESLNAYVHRRAPGTSGVATFLICDHCRDAREVADPQLTRALSALSDARRFAAVRHVVEIHGACARCRPQAAPPTA